jgi:hypothetical protein
MDFFGQMSPSARQSHLCFRIMEVLCSAAISGMVARKSACRQISGQEKMYFRDQSVFLSPGTAAG